MKTKADGTRRRIGVASHPALISLFALLLTTGCARLRPLPPGMDMAGPQRPSNGIHFLRDLTYADQSGKRHHEQEIFDTLFDLIQRARTMVVADMFLYNAWIGEGPEPLRRLTAELTEALCRKKQSCPECTVVLITDPINTLYGGVRAPHLEQLAAAGVIVIKTDLDRLPDSNPIYSFWWRLLARPFGNSPGGLLPNPFGSGGVSVRTYLRMLNFKANHRKVLIADPDGVLTGMVTSANPHDGSSAHSNIAVVFEGEAAMDLLLSELAVAAFSGHPLDLSVPVAAPGAEPGPATLQVVTEASIERALVEALNLAGSGDEVDVVMFYLSDRDVVRALCAAHRRGARLRIVLDPSKDAFGRQKSGIPNRQTGRDLNAAGVPLRWYRTRGEQCHSKMLLVRYGCGEARLIAGSANFTRRNLGNYNLETNVVVSGPVSAPALAAAREYVDDIWLNRDGRVCTVDYRHYRDRSPVKRWKYLLMEWTGISTF